MSIRFWLATLIAAPVLFAADRVEQTPRVVEEIVAKVNSDIITRGELAKQRAEIEAELQQQRQGAAPSQAAVDKRLSDLLRDQIDQLLLVQKGKELNINVESEINRRVAEIQSQSKISDPEKFHDWLREQSGVSYEDFRLQTKNQLVTQRVLSEEVWRNITIPRAEQEKYYNDHKADFVREEIVMLRELLVSTGDNSADRLAAAEKKAKSLTDRARKGEKFGDLARQNSDAATAAQDGELGSFKRGQLRKEIDDVVFVHDKGYVTDPIKTPNGFAIFRVEERYSPGLAAFEEVQNEINSILAEPRGTPRVREFLTKLRTNAFLQVKPGFVDSGAAPGKDTTWQDPAQLRPETTTKEAVTANRRKRLLKIIPYGRAGKTLPEEKAAAAPAVAPVPTTRVKIPGQ